MFQEILSILDGEGFASAKVVFYLLLALGALAVWLFGHRFFYLHRVHNDYEEFMGGLLNKLSHLTGASICEAISLCDEEKTPLTSVAHGILSCGKRDAASLRQAADEVASLEIPRLQRNARLVAGVGQLSPFLGLLGTIVSLMPEFEKLSGETAMSLRDMSGAFRVAFLLMAVSVIINMLVVLFNLILSEKAHAVVYDMERASHELIALLSGSGKADSLNADLLSGGKRQ
jgi:biopolymer transport protein ExbB